jgi:hypothetical protein
MEGYMVSLGALDLILRNIRAGMMGIAFDIEGARVHADDRAADAPRLRIPTHAIADFEVIRHDDSVLKSADSAKLSPKRRTDHTSLIEIEFVSAVQSPLFILVPPKSGGGCRQSGFPFETRTHSIHDIGQTVAP